MTDTEHLFIAPRDEDFNGDQMQAEQRRGQGGVDQTGVAQENPLK